MEKGSDRMRPFKEAAYLKISVVNMNNCKITK